jgi:hypothetical protein
MPRVKGRTYIPKRDIVRIRNDFENVVIDAMEERGIQTYAELSRLAGTAVANENNAASWINDALRRARKQHSTTVDGSILKKMEDFLGISLRHKDQMQGKRTNGATVWIETITTNGKTSTDLVYKCGTAEDIQQLCEDDCDDEPTVIIAISNGLLWAERLGVPYHNKTKHQRLYGYPSDDSGVCIIDSE